jgi:hypothetical protein
MTTVSPPIAFLALCLVCVAMPALPREIEVFPGEPPVTYGLGLDELLVHPMSGEGSAEAWYLMARLDDGSDVFVTFGISNLGIGDSHGIVDVTVIEAGGDVHHERSRVRGKRMAHSPDRLEIRFGDRHSLTGDGRRLRLRSRGETIGFDLRVEALVTGLRFGDGKSWLDARRRRYYALAILTPKGKVTGSLRTGGSNREVSGHAYADHAWHNVPAHKLARRVVSMRGFTERTSVALLAFETPEGPIIPTLVVTEGRATVLATHRLAVESENLRQGAPTRGPNAGRITLRSAGTPSVTGVITLGELRQRREARTDATFLERIAIRMLAGRPSISRFESTWSLRVGSGATARTFEGGGVTEIVDVRGRD